MLKKYISVSQKTPSSKSTPLLLIHAHCDLSFNTAYLRAQGAYYIERTGAIMSGHSQVASGPVLSTGDRYALLLLAYSPLFFFVFLTLSPFSVGFRLNLDEETFEIFHNGVSVYTFTGIRYLAHCHQFC